MVDCVEGFTKINKYPKNTFPLLKAFNVWFLKFIIASVVPKHFWKSNWFLFNKMFLFLNNLIFECSLVFFQNFAENWKNRDRPITFTCIHYAFFKKGSDLCTFHQLGYVSFNAFVNNWLAVLLAIEMPSKLTLFWCCPQCF